MTIIRIKHMSYRNEITMVIGSPPPHPHSTHIRKTSQTPKKEGHERCQHTWKLVQLGQPPNPTASWRPYIFRVFCLVTKRWMKVRVPFAWFWYGEDNWGSPEIEAGTIADSVPIPPQIERDEVQF